MLDPNMTKIQFEQISDSIITAFQPLAELHGAKLSVNKAWDDSTVNAYAEELTPDDWQVFMFGGLARRPEVTLDGFALVVCHELGHHFGGYAFKTGFGHAWAATEGEADYFATQACAHKIWERELDKNAEFRKTVDPVVQKKCDQTWASTADQNLCYRTASASMSLANLLSVLGDDPKTPQFDTPDPAVVDATYEAHPYAQCRLDTYFSGAICGNSFDLKIIPGKDYADGQGSVGAEKIAAQYSCLGNSKSGLGDRPRCWFRSVQLPAPAPAH